MSKQEPIEMISFHNLTFGDVVSVTLNSPKKVVTDIVKTGGKMVYVIFDQDNRITVKDGDEHIWLWPREN